ncbi:MAG: hypothetical protein ABIH26_05290 [Candidatus Eisenbacteria bacterium]
MSGRPALAVPLILAVLLPGCGDSTAPGCPSGGTVIYSNSFETEADTVGWVLGSASLREGDTPPGGGSRALYVSGGCLWPHAYHDLPPLGEGASLVVRCWGKNLDQGGGVLLGSMDDWLGAVRVGFIDTVWTCRQSEDTLECSAGESLQIMLQAGGFVPSAILVDRIEVVSVP